MANNKNLFDLKVVPASVTCINVYNFREQFGFEPSNYSKKSIRRFVKLNNVETYAVSAELVEGKVYAKLEREDYIIRSCRA